MSEMFKRSVEELEPISLQNARSGGGIPLSANFNLNGQMPLDDRTVVDTLNDRNNMPEIRKYEGMVVYVKENKTSYQLIDNDWKKYGVGSVEDIEDIHTVAKSGDYNDLINTPKNVSEFNNDLDFVSIAIGENAPEEEHKNVWFDTSPLSIELSQDDGIYLNSDSGVFFKICVTPEGRLFTCKADIDPIFIDDIIIMSENNNKFLLKVNDDGMLYTEPATL